MHWAKIAAWLVLGAVLGGVITGYAVFEYMSRFGIDWNRWASSQQDERTATDALATVMVLDKLQTGGADNARNLLEWRVVVAVPVLTDMKRRGRDTDGSTTKALSAIRAHRQAHPWSSGDSQLDQQIADELGGLKSR